MSSTALLRRCCGGPAVPPLMLAAALISASAPQAVAQQILKGGGDGGGFDAGVVSGSGGIAGGGGGSDLTWPTPVAGGDAALAPNGQAAAGNGSVSGTAGVPNDVSAGGGGGGDGSNNAGAGGAGGVVDSSTSVTLTGLRIGGFGHPTSGFYGGGGGAGAGLVLSGTGASLDTADQLVFGGTGGSTAGRSAGAGGGGGGGGGGGVGIVLLNGGSVLATANSTIRGGNGGMGYIGGGGAAALFLYSGGALSNNGAMLGGTGGDAVFGLGGVGGAGVLANQASILNAGVIAGGSGGSGFSPTSGTGGGGGSGIEVWQSTITNAVGGTIIGGAGGNGLFLAGNIGGPGGDGGAGVLVRSGGGSRLENHGVIVGGAGGSGDSSPAGAGGAGVIGADLTVVNSGSIVGGLSGDAVSPVQANAVTFTSGTNVYEMWAGASVAGSVVDQTGNGTFRLGGAANGSFDASNLTSNTGGSETYRGFASFEKTGSSVWTVIGTSTFTGGVNVDAGTLVVNGNLSSASLMFVNPGGTLSGTGTVPFTLLDDGATLAPGPINGIGALTINDRVLFCACSTYAVKVSATGSDRANIVAGGSGPGDAFLEGRVRVTSPTGSYRFNSAYTILSAQGGLNGTTFGELVTPTGIGGVLSYTSNDVLLTLTSQLGQIAGLNRNQQRVANTFDNVINMSGSINGLGGIFGSNIAQNLTQASGELGTGSQQTTFQATNMFMGLMTDPFAAGRGGAGGANSATGFADEESIAYAGRAKSKSPRDAFAAFTKAPPAVAFAQRWNVWAAGYGGSQTTDGNAVTGSNTATSSIYGAAVGADYWFSPDTVAGFALAGGGSNFSVANGGSGRSDMFQAGAFVRHNFDATYLTASVAYGWQDVTTDRYVSIAGVDHLRANFNANAYSGRLELGHRFLTPWFGGLGVSPYAAAQITAFELPSYAERAISGASTFALNYGADTATASRTELGLRTDKSYALDGAVLTLRGRAAWAHDFNPDSAVSATFQTLPGASFVVNGAALASDSALTTASAEVRWLNGWSVAATFEGEFSDVTRSYAGKGVVRYTW